MAQTGLFLKFDPEKLLSASAELDVQQKKLLGCTSAIKKRAEGLTGNWHGDSASLYLDKISELDRQSEEMAAVLLTLSRDLVDASGIYKSGETAAKRKAEALPTDGVFLV